jgi:hypothetical protein
LGRTSMKESCIRYINKAANNQKRYSYFSQRGRSPHIFCCLLSTTFI